MIRPITKSNNGIKFSILVGFSSESITFPITEFLKIQARTKKITLKTVMILRPIMPNKLLIFPIKFFKIYTD